ncbi:MAG: glycoside hydrolase family 127 protein [Armatimonadetes bacterium]|nr:glycoside hydrolase family 127 protein [Armatimonadota bacterium]
MLCQLALSIVLAAGDQVTFVKSPSVASANAYYVGNRAPLARNPLIKLPVGSVTASGWLREYLKRQRAGLNGNLPHISAWLKVDGNAWLDKDGKGHAGWEEVPYWLKGYISLAYQLKDPTMIKEAQGWIEAALASQRPDGDFGPNQHMDDGSRDFWGNMLMLECLRTYYEATHDKRVIDLMTSYFHYQLTIPDKEFLTGYWQHARGGDNLSSIYWLYDLTGDSKLLELAEKNHRRTMDWSMKDSLPDWHNVNVAECFDEPGIFFQQSKKSQSLQAAYNNFATMRRLYGNVPGGMYGADENARPGKSDPRQAVETCGMVEQMYSDEELLGISGDTMWADHCENVAFNTYPAALTPDCTSLRYLTSPNMATSDQFNHAPGYQNGGPMTMYNPLSHRCCQHNHGMGWPYFSEHLWMATNDNGLAAALYSASSVTAKAGDGRSVTIKEDSHYPFEQSIRFSIDTGKKSNRFPLYLRLPAWTKNATLTVNGKAMSLAGKESGFMRIERAWKTGDKVALELPMKLSVQQWQANHDSVSVDYGPLTFSLKIGEKVTRFDSTKTALGDSQWQKSLDTEAWPAYAYTPTTPWNYALAIDPAHPERSLTVAKRPWPSSNFPFTLDEVPIQIQAKGAILPSWTIDRFGLVSELQQSPTVSADPVQKITLVPMGAARLRISAFPWLAKNGKPWAEPPKPLPYGPTASHVFESDDVIAMCDGILPKSSGDEGIPRFTWWDHKGSTEWVQYNFEKPRSVKGVDVYWFDDSGHGMCRVPKSWSILGLVDGKWVPIKPNGEPGCDRDLFNRVNFAPLTVSGLRLQVQLQTGFSGGILEWQVR